MNNNFMMVFVVILNLLSIYFSWGQQGTWIVYFVLFAPSLQSSQRYPIDKFHRFYQQKNFQPHIMDTSDIKLQEHGNKDFLIFFNYGHTSFMTNKKTNEFSRLLGLGSNIRNNILRNFFSSYFVKKERKYLVNDPTYFLFHVHNKFSSLNRSTTQISSIKISLTKGLIINFLLKFHVHYYGCMHGITQQTMASQLVQKKHNKNMSHLWLDMLDMSTTILVN